jgi:hypothetical protein
MKKLLLSIIGLGIITTSTAQEAADKKVQAGLVAGAGINFQKMGTKNMIATGLGTDLTIGMNVNFNLTNTIGFCTGVEFDFARTRFAPSSTVPTYYYFNDTEILRKDETTAASTLYKLNERSYKATYLTIPTMLLFRTNFIGYFRYFGKFGLRNSFLLSNTMTDQGSTFTNNDISDTPINAENANMKKSGEMFFYKGAVGLAGGTEWNFSGATSLVVELGYYYGITPLFSNPKEDKMSLFTRDEATVTPSYFVNKATQGQLMLKASILF